MVELPSDEFDLGPVLRLSNHQIYMGMNKVSNQMFSNSGVIQPHDR